MLRFSGPAIVPVSCGPRVDRDNRFENTNIQFIFDIPETLSEGASCGADRTVGVGGRCALRSEKDVCEVLTGTGGGLGAFALRRSHGRRKRGAAVSLRRMADGGARGGRRALPADV